MRRFVDAPKALLPLWLLAVIVLVATVAGAAMADAAMSGWPGAIVAVAISWPSVMLIRRELAKRGRTGFEDLPSAEWDDDAPPVARVFSEPVNTLVWFGAALAAGGLATAVGLGTDSDLVGIPAWMACGGLAAGPVRIECDARIALWARRRHHAA